MKPARRLKRGGARRPAWRIVGVAVAGLAAATAGHGADNTCPRVAIGWDTALASCPPLGGQNGRRLGSRPYGAWTSRPFCVEATGREEADEPLRAVREVGEDDADTFGYCLYTDASFGDHGLSIVARPAVARQHVAADMAAVAASGFPANGTVQQWADGEPAHAVVDMPGKGKGVVAARRIRRFETLVVDTAALTIDTHIRSALGRRALRALLQRAAGQLARPATVLSLSTLAGGDGDDGDDGDDGGIGGVVDSVLRTNSFQNQWVSWRQGSLFPEISRINHDCQPNAFLRIAPHGLAAGVAAFRDIEPGEEITISYIMLGLPHADRRALLRPWGFACGCRLCAAASSADSGASDASAALRTALIELRTAMDTAMSRWQLEDAIALAQHGLSMLAAVERHHSPTGNVDTAATADTNYAIDDPHTLLATYLPRFHAMLARAFAVRGDDPAVVRHHARIASQWRIQLAYLEPVDADADVADLLASFE